MAYTSIINAKPCLTSSMSNSSHLSQQSHSQLFFSNILCLYLLYIVPSIIWSLFRSSCFSVLILILASIITFMLYKEGFRDITACFAVTTLFLANCLECFECPLTTISGIFILVGTSCLTSNNKLVHAYTIILCLFTNFLDTGRVFGFEQLEAGLQGIQKMSFLRLVQTIGFFYIMKRKEQNLHKRLLEALQAHETASSQLADVNKFKTTFLSCFSHEVRNPLNVLNGSIELLLRSIKEKTLCSILEGAKLSADVLLKLVNNILDASNIQTDKFELHGGFHNLREVISQLVNMKLEAINQKKLTLQVYIDKQIPEEVYTDASRLLQILLNLVSNAIKFSKEGQLVQVYLTWLNQDAPKVQLLEVSKDNPYIRRSQSPNSRASYTTLTSPTSASPERLPSHFRRNSSEQWLNFGTVPVNKTVFEPSEVLETSALEWNKKKQMNTLKLDTLLKKVSMEEINSACEQMRHKYTIIDTNIPKSLQNFDTKGCENQSKSGILKVEVTDQGCGITPEDQNMLFEMFTQVDSSITRKNGGIGLGLWVTKQIIEKSGGKIKLYSDENMGSTFVFYTPISPPEDSLQGYASLQDGFTRANPSKIHALVVDDIKFNRELLKMLLEAEGVVVHTVDNGLEAVKAYEEKPGDFYDLILTDLQMPIMDGVTSSREIREIQKREGRKEIDIYIVSGNCGENEIRECMDPLRGIGAKDFLKKPVSAKVLKSIIKRKVAKQLSL